MTPAPITTAWAIKALCSVAFIEGLYLGFAVLPYGYEAYHLISTMDITSMRSVPGFQLLFRNTMAFGGIVGVLCPWFMWTYADRCVRVQVQEVEHNG